MSFSVLVYVVQCVCNNCHRQYSSYIFSTISGQHSCEGMYDCHLGSTILSSQVGLTNFDSQTPLEEPVEITFPMEVSTSLELLSSMKRFLFCCLQ